MQCAAPHAGAQGAREKYSNDSLDNDCNRYAVMRNLLHRSGKSVETLASFEPSFVMFAEWWKQLYGESEGKDEKGIMPTSVSFSADLHSMGQFLQNGSRLMFETFVKFRENGEDLTVERTAEDFDGLNYLAGRAMTFVNDNALNGTVLAHVSGGVPCMIIEADKNDETNVGELIYFFERACAVSGYILGVNPFNQPGVESYKKNMFALLGKPGYEEMRAELEKKLNQ